MTAVRTPTGRGIRTDEAFHGLKGGPVVRMRADELAPFGWGPAMVLVAINLVDRIDASIVTGILPQLKEQWGISDTLGGAIPFAALIAGALASLPAGYLADRHDRTKLLAFVVGSWAVLTAVSGIAIGFWMFFVVRAVLGASDHLATPAASSLMADFYPPRARGKAFAYQRMAYYAGGAIGVLIGGIFGQLFGWRSAFFVMVIPGPAVAGLCWVLREPIRGAIDKFVAQQGRGDAEVSSVDAAVAAEGWVEAAEAGDTGAARESMPAQIARLLRVKTIFFLYTGTAILAFGLAGIFFWLPSFYQRYRGISESGAGGLTALVSLIGIIGGAYVGGYVGDRWHRTRAGGRILLSGTGLLIGSIVLLLSFDAPKILVQVSVLTVSVFFLSLAAPNLTAATADVLTAEQRGVGFAFYVFMTTAGSALGPLAVGIASDVTHQLKLAFYILVAPLIVGSLIILVARKTFASDAERVLLEAQS